MDYAAAIDKNRRALLRIVVFWLVVARCVSRTKVYLPLRLSRYINTILFKLEASLGFLIQAATACGAIYGGDASAFLLASSRHRAGLGAFSSEGQLSLALIITRLRALRAGLVLLAKAQNLSLPCAVHHCTLSGQNFCFSPKLMFQFPDILTGKAQFLPP